MQVEVIKTLRKKYTAKFKLEKVREYLNKVEKREKISKANFAYESGLSHSTFNDWVIKHKK